MNSRLWNSAFNPSDFTNVLFFATSWKQHLQKHYTGDCCCSMEQVIRLSDGMCRAAAERAEGEVTTDVGKWGVSHICILGMRMSLSSRLPAAARSKVFSRCVNTLRDQLLFVKSPNINNLSLSFPALRSTNIKRFNV